MAALPAPDQALVYSAAATAMNGDREPCPVTKALLKQTIAEIDAWAEANAASFNAAISQPARGLLSARQKARLLMLVLNRRFEVQ
jgi:hypothetical protein